MKVLRNIIPALEIKKVLNELGPYREKIIEKRHRGALIEERQAILETTKYWSRRMIEEFDIRVDLKGKENLPDDGPVVFVGNHQGYADIVLCLYAFDKFQTGFVAKSSLEKVPYFGKWIKEIRSIFIERDDSRASLEAIKKGIDLIEEGFSLVIFPEGTRSKSDEIADFRKGPLKLATKPGVPIIPFTIMGSHKIFEDRGIATKAVDVSFTIHQAIETKGLTREETKALDDKVEAIVKQGGV